MALRWLFLDMNSFFASVEQQEDPRLRGRPVAVVPMESDATCCIAASYEAKAFGVKTGTGVAEAKRLCPHICIVPAWHERYRDYHAAIVEVVGDCLPIDKVLSVDEMVCRLWENERLPADAVRMGEHLKQEIRTRVGDCMHCSVGLSLNPFLAKVAAEMQKPNGMVVLDAADLPHKLFGLRLTDFPGISHAMETRFQSAGVWTTEQMYGLNCPQMRRVWGGVRGEMWWRLLRGEAVEEPPTVRRSVGHSHVLGPEMRTPPGAAMVAGRLLEKAGERLRHLGFYARGMSAHVRGPERQSWERKVRFAPCQDHWTLAIVLNSLWEHPFQVPTQVSVVLYDLIAEGDVTLPLFDEAEKRLCAARVLDQVNQQFGRGTLSSASVLPARHMAEDKISFGKVKDLC